MNNFERIKKTQTKEINSLKENVKKEVESAITHFNYEVKDGISSDKLYNLIMSLNRVLQTVSKAEAKQETIEHIDFMRSAE